MSVEGLTRWLLLRKEKFWQGSSHVRWNSWQTLLYSSIIIDKDLRDNEDLEIKVIKFVWASVKLFARD